MRTPIAALLLGTLVLTGCATKLNPFNWFKRGSTQETLAELPDPTVINDNRALVQQVVSLSVDKTPGGAIIRATGLPPTQGYWDAELVPENGEEPVKGVLTYQFRIEEPIDFQRVSTPQSREVVVARFVSNIKLDGVRQIRVVGAKNARSTRR
ncbi:hypothetical protein [Profundibacter sp.]|uniref:hypothetical protein n=1 Tax=Profundibacter sp. TaxID=3101071 RepID=UPI003D0BF07B